MSVFITNFSKTAILNKKPEFKFRTSLTIAISLVLSPDNFSMNKAKTIWNTILEK